MGTIMVKVVCLIAINGDEVYNVYTNYLFEVASIKLGTKTPSFSTECTQCLQEDVDSTTFWQVQKFLLVAEKLEVALMTNEW